MALRRLAALAFVLSTLSLDACGGGGGAGPTCTDGARNGDETAVDCGGAACPPCADGLACAGDRDCRSARCAGGACAAPACNDLVRNGLETGVDCGGPCAPCADGLACAVDGDCQSGRCAGQVCLKALGAGCGGAGACASGRCVDGVCCESACDGTCEACNLPGRFGHCDPVPDGEDPAGECAAEAPGTCGLDGACSGGRACRRHAAGTACAPAACLDAATAQPGAACDGAGTCVTPPPLACSPLTCDGAAGACRTACADSSQCAAGHGCAPGGGCLKLDGQACGADVECLHGFCTDGVCCQARCDGACEACDQAGRAGFCDPIPAGQDPAEECATTPAATCGTSGACSGSRSCALWSGATTCAAASCDSATVSRPASLCSGAGACQSQGTVDCAPLTCDGATGACKATCAVDADCAPGYGCFGGACKKVQGAACAIDAECGTGFCTDGVCCQARCGGTCEACNQAGRAGLCDPVPAGADPASECPQDACHPGVCSGGRTCAVAADATPCGAGLICAAGACVDLNECTSGAATCSANATCTNTVGGYTCACNAGFLGDGFTCRRPVSCAELHSASPGSPSGLYAIDPDGAGGLAEFSASCDMTTDGGGWTVFQRRQDATDFYRTYAEYQAGFGSPAGSHWLGLDRLVALTATARALRVELTSPVKGTGYESYASFSVGAGPDYVLNVSGPSGTAGDGLGYHNGMRFSARDRDQDAYAPDSCAVLLRAGWWFNACHTTNLNGPFSSGTEPSGVIISWWPFQSLTSGLLFAELKLR